MNFGEAIKALKEGKMVKRKFWPYGTFIFMQVPSTIDKSIVPKMTSLPQSVKEEFELRFEVKAYQSISYDNQIAIVNSNNQIFGWSPSAEECFVEDWEIMDQWKILL